MRRLFATSAVIFCTIALSHSQEEGEKKDPEKAFVRIVNASTVVLKEPWRSGVDLMFKDNKLATDIRAGEGGGYRLISFTGKDKVEAMETGSTKVVGSVPASFEKGAFYSVYLTGLVNDGGFKIAPTVIKDFPIPAEKMRKGYARVGMFNAVSTFPVQIQIDNGTRLSLPALGSTEVFLSPGSHPYRLIFPYKKTERDMQGFLMVTADSDFSVIVCASSEKPDRPVLRIFDNTLAKSDIEEQLKAEEETKKQAAADKLNGTP